MSKFDTETRAFIALLPQRESLDQLQERLDQAGLSSRTRLADIPVPEVSTVFTERMGALQYSRRSGTAQAFESIVHEAKNFSRELEQRAHKRFQFTLDTHPERFSFTLQPGDSLSDLLNSSKADYDKYASRLQKRLFSELLFVVKSKLLESPREIESPTRYEIEVVSPQSLERTSSVELADDTVVAACMALYVDKVISDGGIVAPYGQGLDGRRHISTIQLERSTIRSQSALVNIGGFGIHTLGVSETEEIGSFPIAIVLPARRQS